ncbi:FRG domain-containing protein [Yersinia enterocolitica]
MSSGHFEIKRTKNGQFHFNLKTSNGEIVLSSEMYANNYSAKIGAKSVEDNAGNKDRYDIKQSVNGYYFILKDEENRVIGIGESFETRKGVQNAINRIIDMFDGANEIKEINLSLPRVGTVTSFTLELQNLAQDKDYIYYFRGHSDSDYSIIPSVYREKKWVESEDKLFRELMLKCPNDFNASMTAFQCLVKMQHYSLPTRLLDITSNALVALYFATERVRDTDKDGEVIIFKIPKKDIKYYDDAHVSLLSNISKMTSDFKLIKNGESEYHKDECYEKLIHEVKREGGFIKSFGLTDIHSVLCVKPQMDNPRIIRQDGAFLLFGVDGGKEWYSELGDTFKPENMYPSILISKEGKRKIRMHLEDLGISGSAIYPEIEHVANYLKEKYIE